jgi:hypothetical protein
MAGTNDSKASGQRKRVRKWPPNDESSRIISYNIPEGERPGGIKVRFKIRVVTGKRAKEIDARQARAILEVLQWQHQHHERP